jgi:hypothetical protein
LIKQLQGQLVKCGVRKVWAFELKKCGDDKKARIRHLKGMLTDVGMVGRFSEARAREIKERRELEADLGAIKEGEKNWGLGRGGRRRGDKSFKEPSDDEDDDEEAANDKSTSKARGDDEDDDDDSGEDFKPKVYAGRASKARQAFAFLSSDEGESD